MYIREFLLCCCSYLNGEREKQTHLCRTNGLSDIATLPMTIDFIDVTKTHVKLNQIITCVKRNGLDIPFHAYKKYAF
jgi:hypothetical protein